MTETVHVSNLYVFEEFEELLPPVSQVTIDELEAGILEHGFDDNPIVYWSNSPDGKPTVIDGHRRLRMWERLQHVRNEPRTKPMEFDSQAAVEKWIVQVQNARRNCTLAEQDAYMAKLNEREKARSKSDGRPPKTVENTDSKTGDTVAPVSDDDTEDGKAAARVAEQAGVSERTVHRAVARHEERKAAPAIIRSADVQFAEQIESGEIEVSDADLRALGKLKPAEIREAAKRIRLGEPWKKSKPPAAKGKGKGKSKPKNPFKELEKTIGTVSRALLAAGKVHGETDQYTTIFEAITTIKTAIEEWQAA